MGQKLEDFYAKAQQMGGLKAKMRLAILTRVSSAKASATPDTPDNIKVFEDAMIELQKEFR